MWRMQNKKVKKMKFVEQKNHPTRAQRGRQK
jgi:hypothetical protein